MMVTMIITIMVTIIKIEISRQLVFLSGTAPAAFLESVRSVRMTVGESVDGDGGPTSGQR